MPDPRDDQRFTDREMRVIFERAGQLDIASARDRRYSLAELQEMGAQAGLDANDVAKAAASVRAPSGASRLLGDPTRFQAATQIDHHLAERGLQDVVDEIRNATGLHGELRMVPGGVEWRARSAASLVVADIQPRNKGTRISVLIARGDHAFLTVLGTGMAGVALGIWSGVASALQLHAVVPAIAVGAVVGTATTWGLTRILWRRVANRCRAQLQAVMDGVIKAAGRVTDSPE